MEKKKKERTVESERGYPKEMATISDAVITYNLYCSFLLRADGWHPDCI